MNIAVDFDGTITTENRFPDIAELRPYVKEAISKLQAQGHKFYLWSCRAGLELQSAINFLEKNGIKLDGYNVCNFEYGNRKMICDLYIDDRAYPCLEIDWKQIYKDLSIKGDEL